jgi:hypothetical protein
MDACHDLTFIKQVLKCAVAVSSKSLFQSRRLPFQANCYFKVDVAVSSTLFYFKVGACRFKQTVILK